MKPDYPDIKRRIKEKPKWYDMHGVPRYDDFSPELCSNVYADEVVLMEIQCQACGKHFLVELNWDGVDEFVHSIPSLEKRILNQTICYGDPPIHENCDSGLVMNSIPLRIIEYWERRTDPFVWKRRKKLEIKIMPEEWEND